MRTHPHMYVHTHRPHASNEPPLLEPVVLPSRDDHDQGRLAWAEARFALELLTEHALFFVFLMPHLSEAPLAYCTRLRALHTSLDEHEIPTRHAIVPFIDSVIATISHPLYERTRRSNEVQGTPTSHTLAWQLLASYTEHEVSRWMNILTRIRDGTHSYERTEVVTFWGETMARHEQFLSHLMDDRSIRDILQEFSNVYVFEEIASYIPGLRARPTSHSNIVWYAKNPSLEEVVDMTQFMLSLEHGLTRSIEAIWLRDALDRFFADHLRREAIKFIDEIDRTQ